MVWYQGMVSAYIAPGGGCNLQLSELQKPDKTSIPRGLLLSWLPMVKTSDEKARRVWLNRVRTNAAQAVRLTAAKASLTQGAPLPTTPTIGPHSLRPSQLCLTWSAWMEAITILIASSTIIRRDEGILIGPVTVLLLKSEDIRTIAFISTYPPTLST